MFTLAELNQFDMYQLTKLAEYLKVSGYSSIKSREKMKVAIFSHLQETYKPPSPFTIPDVESGEVQMSVRVRRIYESTKKGE